MRHLVTIMAGETLGKMAPVLASDDPEIVSIVKEAILDRLGSTAPERQRPPTAAEAPEADGSSWGERLWTCPPETRLGVRELAEAVGRPRSWVYRHTAPKGDLAPIPHRRFDGLLAFLAGEIREWLAANEEINVPPTLPAAPMRPDKLGKRTS